MLFGKGIEMMGVIIRVVEKLIPRKIKSRIRNSIIQSGNREVQYNINISHEGRLQGKTVMVTGATGAIGSAICYRLVTEGAIVGVCGRSQDKINKVIQHIDSSKKENIGLVMPVILDVTDVSSIDSAFDEFIRMHGGIDILINNAGGGARGQSKSLHQQEIEIIDSVLDTNLRGSILCARKAANQMVLQNSGKIINMSSVVGMAGKSKMVEYAASKAGIIGFTKSLALELGKYNINVNCVSPGMVNQIVFDRGLEERPTKSNCLGHFGRTDDVANLVAFLVSEEANYITGQNFVIDGGRSLGLMGDS